MNLKVFLLFKKAKIRQKCLKIFEQNFKIPTIVNLDEFCNLKCNSQSPPRKCSKNKSENFAVSQSTIWIVAEMSYNL